MLRKIVTCLCAMSAFVQFISSAALMQNSSEIALSQNSSEMALSQNSSELALSQNSSEFELSSQTFSELALSSPNVDYHLKTRITMHQYTFKWTFDDVNDYYGGDMESYAVSPDNLSKWKIIVSLGSKLHLRLNRYDVSRQRRVKTEIRTVVKDSGGKVWLNESKVTIWEEPNSHLSLIDGMQFLVNQMKRTSKDSFDVTVHLKIFRRISGEVEVPPSLPTKEKFQQDLQKAVVDDLVKLYDNQEDIDVELTADYYSIGAHKAVLTARSPVFADLFMSENQTNVINVSDVTSFALRELVAFMYGKFAPDYSFQNTLEVYYAAGKFEMEMLKSRCAGMLTSKLDYNNAGQILRIAHSHSDENLKKNVLDFIRKNLASCVTTEWWCKMVAGQGEDELVRELKQILTDKLRSK